MYSTYEILPRHRGKQSEEIILVNPQRSAYHLAIGTLRKHVCKEREQKIGFECFF